MGIFDGKLFNWIFGGIQLIAGIFLVASGVGAGFGLKLILSGGLTILSGLVTESGRSGFESSPTYGFNNTRNDVHDGTPVRIVYGSVRLAPQFVSVNVDTARHQQTLKIIGLIGEGEIESISQIRINNAPLSSFPGAFSHIRLGTDDQAGIPGFHETATSFDRSTIMSKGVTHIHPGSAPMDEIDFVLTFRGGLFHRDNKGRYHSVGQTIKVEYKVAGQSDSHYVPYTPSPRANAGDWHPLGPGGFGFSGTYLSATFTHLRVKFPRRDNWVVKLTGFQDSDPGNGWILDYTLENIIEIKNDNNAYPGFALVALTIPATGQIQDSVPHVTCLVQGRKVYDPRNQKTAWSRNRALCIRDLLLNKRFGVGNWVQALEIDDSIFGPGTWVDVANALESTITTPDGSRIAKDELDYVIDVKAKAGDHLAQMLAGGRLNLFVTDGKIKIQIDEPKDSVRTFVDQETEGERHNIARVQSDDGRLASTLVETETPYSERFNVVRVRYVDRLEDYQPRTVEVKDWRVDFGAIESGPGFVDNEECLLDGVPVAPPGGTSKTLGQIRFWIVKAPPNAGGVVHIIRNPAYDHFDWTYFTAFGAPGESRQEYLRVKGRVSGTVVQLQGVPYVPTPEHAVEIQLFGVTRESQAVWEARYHLNRIQLRPRVYDHAVFWGDLDLEPGDVFNLKSLRLSDEDILAQLISLSYDSQGRGRMQSLVYEPAVYDVTNQSGPKGRVYAAPDISTNRTLADVMNEFLDDKGIKWPPWDLDSLKKPKPQPTAPKLGTGLFRKSLPPPPPSTGLATDLGAGPPIGGPV